MQLTLKNLLLLFIVIVANCKAQEQNNKHSYLETIVTDLNSDNSNDTISIYQAPVEGDPGEFTKITISLGRHGRKTFTAKDAWDKIDNIFRVKGRNTTASTRVFVHKDASQSVILLFGFPYGSGREEISLTRIKGASAEMIFDNQLEEPISFTDLDNDGIAELICHNEPEMDTKTTGVYSPYMVYTLSGTFNLDKALTEKYNKKHYVWAGFKYNEKIKVYYPDTPGKKHSILK